MVTVRGSKSRDVTWGRDGVVGGGARGGWVGRAAGEAGGARWGKRGPPPNTTCGGTEQTVWAGAPYLVHGVGHGHGGVHRRTHHGHHARQHGPRQHLDAGFGCGVAKAQHTSLTRSGRPVYQMRNTPSTCWPYLGLPNEEHTLDLLALPWDPTRRKDQSQQQRQQAPQNITMVTIKMSTGDEQDGGTGGEGQDKGGGGVNTLALSTHLE